MNELVELLEHNRHGLLHDCIDLLLNYSFEVLQVLIRVVHSQTAMMMSNFALGQLLSVEVSLCNFKLLLFILETS